MNCQCLRVIFAGTPEFAAVALQALLGSEHEVVQVLTQPDRPAGRGRKLTASPVKVLALEHGLSVQQPATLRDAAVQAELAQLAPDVMVVAAYGLLLPAAVIDLPALGCLNIHASLLPRWRGAAPIHRAVLAGDATTGVTIMQMDEGLDTGAMLHRASLPLGANETTGELHDRLASAGAQALLQALATRCEGTVQAIAQPEVGVSYARKLEKREAVLDFSADAIALHRQICAFNPWPVAETGLAGERIRVWRSRLVPGADAPGPGGAAPGTIVAVTVDAVRVATGAGYIDLLELQRPGKRPVAATDMARGIALIGQQLRSE